MRPISRNMFHKVSLSSRGLYLGLQKADTCKQTTKLEARKSGTLYYLKVVLASLTWHTMLFSSFDLGLPLAPLLHKCPETETSSSSLLSLQQQ